MSSISPPGLEMIREGQAEERAARAKQIEGVIALLESEEWQRAGYGSLPAYLSAQLQVSTQTATRLIKDAKEARYLPTLRQDLGQAQVSVDQFRAVATLAHERDEDGHRWANDHTAQVWLEGLWDWPIASLEREARKARARELERSDGGTYFRMSPTPDERYMRGQFQLHPEDGAAVLAAVEARVPHGTPLRDWDQASARALVELATDPQGEGEAITPTVLVSVQEDALARAKGADRIGSVGHGLCYLDIDTISRLTCAGRLQPLATDEAGNIIETGSLSKHVPPHTRRAVLERDDGTCCHPDCDRTKHLVLHHVIPRELGGPTATWNLRPVCWEHHDWVHRKAGWKLVHAGEGRVQWIRPDATPYQPRIRVTQDTS